MSTLSACLSSPRRPARAADGDSSAGRAARGCQPRMSYGTPRARPATSGLFSPTSKHGSQQSLGTSVSVGSSKLLSTCSRGTQATPAVAGRDLWCTGERAQVGRLGNMREALRTEGQQRLEKTLEARRLSAEAVKGRRQVKYEQRLEREELWQEKLQMARDRSAEARRLESWYRQQARERSRVDAKQAEQNSLEEGFRRHEGNRAEKVEHAKARKVLDNIRVVDEREQRLRHARVALKREQEAWHLSQERQQAEARERYEVRQEDIRRQQAELIQKRQGDKAHNVLLAKRALSEQRLQQQQERFKVDVVEHRIVKQRLARQEEFAAKDQVVNMRERGRRELHSSFRKTEQERRRDSQQLQEDRQRSVSNDRRTHSMEAQVQRREEQRVQRQQQVEQRQVRSARSHVETWEDQEQRRTRWGAQAFRLDKSDGDISVKSLAFTQARQRR